MPKKKSSPCGSFLDGSAKDPIRVLVAWSPSSVGTEAIEFAAWLSHSCPLNIRVLSTFIQPWHSTSMHKLGGKYKKWFKREAEACANAVKEALQDADVDRSMWDKKYSILVDGPSKPQMLTEAADEFQADLVLLGPNQAAPKGLFRAGSTADTLLHYSPVPLGLIPRQPKLSKHGVTRVNFAFTDQNGKQDDPALCNAAGLAARLGVPLRIMAFSSTGMVHAPINDKLDVAQALTHEWREHALALLDRARDHVTEEFEDLDVSIDIGSGEGWAGAVDSLKWKKGDIMVMGSNPMGPIARVFIGSTATELLQHLRVPVLVHPAASPHR